MVLCQQTLIPISSKSTGSTSSRSNASESLSISDGPSRLDIQLALSNSDNCTYALVDKPQKNKRTNGQVWERFKMVKRIEDNKMMQFAQCQDCDNIFTYKPQNGSNNLKVHSQKCIGNEDNFSSTQREAVNQIVKAKFGDASRKAVTKASVEMCALDLRPFIALSGVGFKGLLRVCMTLAQNVQGIINVDDILPHPVTVSRNVDFYAGEIRKCLAKEMKSVMDERVSVSFTTDMKTEDYTKTSYSALTSHYIDSKWNLRHPTMGCKEFQKTINTPQSTSRMIP